MKSSKNALHAYLSAFGSIKILVWIVALGVIAAYGLLDTEASQPIGNPYQQGQYAPPLQQQVQQSGQYQPGSQQFLPNSRQQFPGGMNSRVPQMQQNGGYPNGPRNNYSSDTPVTYPKSQTRYNQQTESLNYGY